MAEVTYYVEAEHELVTGADAAKYLTKLSLTVERTAKRLAPVDTGRLRSSIGHTLVRDSEGLLALVGSRVAYAGYVEYGTRKMRARPYLRPALRSIR